MGKGKVLSIIVGALVFIVTCTFIGLFVIKLVWGWVVPDICAGAVEQGLVLGSLSFWQAFKLSIICGLLFGASKASATSKKG